MYARALKLKPKDRPLQGRASVFERRGGCPRRWRLEKALGLCRGQGSPPDPARRARQIVNLLKRAAALANDGWTAGSAPSPASRPISRPATSCPRSTCARAYKQRGPSGEAAHPGHRDLDAMEQLVKVYKSQANTTAPSRCSRSWPRPSRARARLLQPDRRDQDDPAQGRRGDRVGAQRWPEPRIRSLTCDGERYKDMQSTSLPSPRTRNDRARPAQLPGHFALARLYRNKHELIAAGKLYREVLERSTTRRRGTRRRARRQPGGADRKVGELSAPWCRSRSAGPQGRLPRHPGRAVRPLRAHPGERVAARQRQREAGRARRSSSGWARTAQAAPRGLSDSATRCSRHRRLGARLPRQQGRGRAAGPPRPPDRRPGHQAAHRHAQPDHRDRHARRGAGRRRPAGRSAHHSGSHPARPPLGGGHARGGGVRARHDRRQARPVAAAGRARRPPRLGADAGLPGPGPPGRAQGDSDVSARRRGARQRPPRRDPRRLRLRARRLGPSAARWLARRAPGRGPGRGAAAAAWSPSAGSGSPRLARAPDRLLRQARPGCAPRWRGRCPGRGWPVGRRRGGALIDYR